MSERPDPQTIALAQLFSLQRSDVDFAESLPSPDALSSLTARVTSSFFGGGLGVILASSSSLSSLREEGTTGTYNTERQSSIQRQSRDLVAAVYVRAGPIATQRWFDTLRKGTASVDGLIDQVETLGSCLERERTNENENDNEERDQEDGVDRDSAVGIFLRRLILGFERLPFEAVGNLWLAYREYVSEGAKVLESITIKSSQEKKTTKETKSKRESDKTNATVSFSFDEEPRWFPSPDQVERALHYECLRFDTPRGGGGGGLHGSFEEVEYGVVQRSLYTNPELPAAHFLRYLNCLHHREHVGAVESLHRFFDYATIHGRRSFHNLGKNKNSDKGGSAFVGTVYAAVLSAASACILSGPESALARTATEEALRVAQQSGDATCVAYATAWSALSSRACRSGNGGQFMSPIPLDNENNSHAQRLLLAGCAASAVDLGLPDLVAGTSLALARHEASHTTEHDNATPANLWAYLDRALSLGEGNGAGANASNNHARLGGVPGAANGPGGAGGAMHHPNRQSAASLSLAQSLSSSPSLMDVQRTLGLKNLVASGLWESFGHTSLASVTAASALQCYGHCMSAEQYNSAIHKIVGGILRGERTTGYSTRSFLEGSGIAITSGPDHEAVDGSYDGRVSFLRSNFRSRGRKRATYSSSASTHNSSNNNHYNNGCIYANALRAMMELRRCKFGPIKKTTMDPSDASWVRGVLSILHQWSLNRYELGHAQVVDSFLQTVPSPSQTQSNGNGILETTVQSLFCRVRLFAKMGQKERAVGLCRRLCEVCSPSTPGDDGPQALGASGSGLRYHHAHGLLLLAEMYLEGASSSSITTTIRAVLPPLLECLSLCETASMDTAHATAVALLAQVYLHLGHPVKARCTLQAVLPKLLNGEADATARAHAWLTLAKCRMREASSLPSTTSNGKPFTAKSPRFRRTLRYARSHLEEAVLAFQRIQHIHGLRETYYLLARLCHSLSIIESDETSSTAIATRGRSVSKQLVARRDEASKAYRELCERICSYQTTWTVSEDMTLILIDPDHLERFIGARQ